MTPCGHWIGAERRYCEATPARRYKDGWRCADHLPVVPYLRKKA